MPKRPRDLNQLAKMVVDIATGEAQDTISAKKRDPQLRGRAGGIKGGSARAAKLTGTEKREIAIKAADARWHGKAKKN